MYAITSASASALRAAARIARCSAYCGARSPGVSARMSWASSVVWMPRMRSRVDWGLGLVMLSFWPMMRLRRVDLPALGFPTTATIPARVMGER